MAPRIVRSSTLGEKSSESLLEASIGRQIRLRRMLAGLTQAQLATMLGVTFQHVHQFERGFHLNASRLYAISKALAVPVEELYSENEARLDGPISDTTFGIAATSARLEFGLKDDGRLQPEILAIVRAFQRIKAPEDRKRALEWINNLSQGPNAPTEKLRSKK